MTTVRGELGQCGARPGEVACGSDVGTYHSLGSLFFSNVDRLVSRIPGKEQTNITFVSGFGD